MASSKDLTIRGPKTNQLIPRPKNPAKVHELEKERRKNFPTSYGDVTPYVNPRAIREKTFEQFMAEIFLLTPQPKKKTPESRKPKPNPYGEDPEVIARRLKKTQKESSDYLNAQRAAETTATNATRKKAKQQTSLRPGEVKKYDPQTKSYISNLAPAPSTSPQPLRRGEVRTFNKQTNRWESNR
jgi:hypothetical protein